MKHRTKRFKRKWLFKKKKIGANSKPTDFRTLRDHQVQDPWGKLYQGASSSNLSKPGSKRELWEAAGAGQEEDAACVGAKENETKPRQSYGFMVPKGKKNDRQRRIVCEVRTQTFPDTRAWKNSPPLMGTVTNGKGVLQAEEKGHLVKRRFKQRTI